LFKRTHTCGEITAALERQIVTINGWVDRVRNLGGVLFVTIRDRYGKIQVLFRPEDGSLFSEAASLHGEDVVAVTGEIAKRPEGAIKEEMGGGRGDHCSTVGGPLESDHPAILYTPGVRRQRGITVGLSIPRSTAAAYAEKYHVKASSRPNRSRLFQRTPVFGDRNSDPHQEYTGRGPRFFGPFTAQTGEVLRAPPIPATVQTVVDGFRIRPLLSNRQMLPRRGFQSGPTT